MPAEFQVLLGKPGHVQYVATVALAGGEIHQLGDGRAAVAGSMKGYAINDIVDALTLGIGRVASASATVFAIGAPVWWDVSANLAVAVPGDAADLYLGVAVRAKASGDLSVDLDLNAGNSGSGSLAQRNVFVTGSVLLDHSDVTQHNVVAAGENPNGLIVDSFRGVVTEAPAGTEDQLIIGLYDEDDTLLSEMTTTDTTPDAAGDWVIGTLTSEVAVTGVVAAVIPAGKGAYVKISQTTTGAAAGAVRVQAKLSPLI